MDGLCSILWFSFYYVLFMYNLLAMKSSIPHILLPCNWLACACIDLTVAETGPKLIYLFFIRWNRSASYSDVPDNRYNLYCRKFTSSFRENRRGNLGSFLDSVGKFLFQVFSLFFFFWLSVFLCVFRKVQSINLKIWVCLLFNCWECKHSPNSLSWWNKWLTSWDYWHRSHFLGINKM